MVSNAGTLWHECLVWSVSHPDEDMDISSVLSLEAKFTGRFTAMFKEARQEAYDLGIKDAASLIDWGKLWRDEDAWRQAQNGAYSVSSYRETVKNLVLGQIREVAK